MKYEGIIFDWAGTTVDYGCMAPVKAFDEAFRAYGIEPTMEEIRKPMGMLKIDHVRTMLGMERINKLWQEKYGRAWTEDDVKDIYELSEKKIFEVLDKYTDIKPHVLETIIEIRKKGLKIGSTTGYTSDMMEIVTDRAKQQGYTPDFWISPDKVNSKGRPYPYMIFRNMEALNLADVRKVLKVGDTVADIKEGLNAGMETVGIIEGSSIMGLTQDEYEALPETEREKIDFKVVSTYQDAGATYIIRDIRALLDLLR
ncbi:phosphonoacetaldehyde hydrolase [Megamonas hypermegale]|uniref:phosphonoacetaldehyde hydrolase n=1 Tax=Megamonas hypermegale TaxID=158847 RepID=UPI0026E922E5|nr:phosphonoacetaldehyde hydrolase [Megamonas hypermegale]